MSKRYGRNQKRRAREQIASLEGRTAYLAHNLRKEKQANDRLYAMVHDWDRDIARLLGRYSAFRAYSPPIYVDEMPKRGWQMSIPQPMSSYAVSLGPEAASIADTIANLNLFLVEHRDDEVHLRKFMRTCFIDRHGNKQHALGYEIDGTQFLGAVVGERERKLIAERISAALVHKMQSLKAA